MFSKKLTMKRTSYLIALIILFISCEPTKNTDEKVNVLLEKEAIGTMLDGWHKSAAAANFEIYFEAMTDKSVFIGTDASENWTIKEFKNFSKPYFDKGKAWSFTPIERNIYVYNDGKIAWFDELLDTWMGVCRGSGVLKKVDTMWKIEHYVLSLTIPNENIQEVKNVNREKDSLFLSKIRKQFKSYF
tara:strand:+ start:9249 stop:9809 length:561 start_codon:yes stop_codon:yes gene_type:complete